MADSKLLRVGCLIQSSRCIIHDAFVKVANTATGAIIAEVGPWKSLPTTSDYLDLSDRVLLPRLINAHCHFEFSDLDQPIQSRDGTFADWIEQVIQKRFQTAGQLSEPELLKHRTNAVRSGQAEAFQSGSIAVGDIVTRPQVDSDLEAGLWCCNFLEVLGLGSDRAKEAIQWARSTVADNSSRSNPQPTGISPHAPYSTCSWLYAQTVKMATEFRLPLATHLAESRDEIELLEHRSGPLVDLFNEMGIWQPQQIEAKSAQDIIDILRPVDDVLLIHGNFLSAEQWRSVPQDKNWSVVYCPQTHKHFQHLPHPWAEMVADGINVALGTDSRASSRSLDLWEDVKVACATQPDQDPAIVFQMATENSAKALGNFDRLGSIHAGKSAQFLIAELDRPFEWEMLPELTPEVLSLP